MDSRVLLDENESSLMLSSYDSEDYGLQINVATDNEEQNGSSSEDSYKHEDIGSCNKLLIDNDMLNCDQNLPGESNMKDGCSNFSSSVHYETTQNSGPDLITISENQSIALVTVDMVPYESSEAETINNISSITPTDNGAVIDPVRTQWVTTKKNKSRLQQSGHTWKKGTWREEEIEKLKENIEIYCRERNISDPVDVIFRMGKEERKDFYPKISAGLNRPLFAVYRRVKRMYDKQNHRGKYTEDEIKRLKQLVSKYGKNWTLIGQKMNRSSDSVRDRCRLFLKEEDTNQLGKWSEEEEQRLAEAVSKVTGKDVETDITDGIIWSSVAKLVQGRTEKQCRAKWLNYLNWKLNNGEKWTKSDDQILIEKLMSLNITSVDEVDWHLLAKNWKSVRSPQWLRFKFWALRRLYTTTQPNKKGIQFNEMLVHLYDFITRKFYNSWSRNWSDRQVKPSTTTSSNYITDIQKNSNAEKWLDGDCYLTTCSKSPSSMSDSRSCEDNLNGVPRLKLSDQMIDASSSDPMLISEEETEESHRNNPPVSLFPAPGMQAQGIYLRTNSDSRNQEIQLMISEDNNHYNIQLTPEVVNFLNSAAKGDGIPHQLHILSSDQDDEILQIQSPGILDYSVSKGNTSPVLSSVMHDVVVGTSASEDEEILTNSQATHLHGELLLDMNELSNGDETDQ